MKDLVRSFRLFHDVKFANFMAFLGMHTIFSRLSSLVLAYQLSPNVKLPVYIRLQALDLFL